MKFGQLIEDDKGVFFLKNHKQNVVEKIVPDSFIKDQISRSTVRNVTNSVFIVMSRSSSTKIY